MPPLATSLSRLGTESAFEVLARARALEAQGRRVLHLEIGEPGVDVAPHVLDACARALREGHTRYGPAAGLPELREAAAEDLGRRRGIAVDPARVVVATGAKPFLLFTILATCDPGDEVVIPDPGFPIYDSAVRFAGCVPVPLRLRDEHGLVPDADALAALIGPRTRLVMLNSPANPTGGAFTRDGCRRVAEVLERHDCWVLSDEVYGRILYGDAHHSPAAHGDLLDRTVLLDGASKTYSMTGMRLGWAALPAALVEPITRLIVNTTSCTPAAVQLAGVAALTGPQDAVEAMVAELRRRRDACVDGLRSLRGVRCAEPRGAFYAFPDVSGTGLPAQTLADRLLEEAGVAVLAGTAFGAGGADHLRLSTAAPLDVIEEAVGAMRLLLERAS